MTGDRPGPASDTSKLLAALGYPIGLVAIIALLIDPYKNEKFVKFHAWQAVGLLIVGLLISFVSWIPVIGWLLGLAWIVLFIYEIYLAIKAYGGDYVEVPVVYGMVKQYVGE